MAEATKPYQIVVGVDYSESGDYALEQALELATKQGNAEVHALSVATLLVPPAAPILELAPVATMTGMSFDEAAEHLRRYLDVKVGQVRDRLGAGAQGRFPRVVPHLRVEIPAQEIAQLAADLDADLVIVGTHGRRGVARVLLGSVAEGVVRLSPCPVLVVRKKRLVTVATIEPPCSECVKARKASNGERFWCAQHSERHGQRHTYSSSDRISKDGSMPLVYHG